MLRKLFTVLTILFAVGVANAQSSTSISASSVTDAFVHPVPAAKLCFQPVDATNTPTGFRVGSDQVVTTPVCGVVSNGVLQSGLSVVPNPTGTYYHITAQNRTTNAIIRDYGMTQITGSSWSLDSYDPDLATLPVSALTMGTVTTLAPGSGASCTITGSGPALLNCGIPKGDTGATGTAATVNVGSTTTEAPGSSATVTNSGSSAAAVLNFAIPQGAAATVNVGTTTTGLPNSSASVTNSGSSGAAVLNFAVPQGPTGATGPAGTTGATGATGATGPVGPAGSGTMNSRGAWAASTAYAVNDVYSYSGTAYVVTASYTSGSTFGSTDTTHAQVVGNYAGVAADGSNGLVVTGNVKAATVNASVNTLINVMAYGAVGDCATDDHNAIMAAQTAAQAYAVGNATAAALYFPKPPGGCYLTSTLLWTGVSLIGQPGAPGTNSPQQYTVTIKGKPGQDVLHVPDPSTASGTFTWNPGWKIQDITLYVDNSTAGSFPHRRPGRWFDDGGMTSGSAAFTTTNASVAPGDVGQAIVVGGAGATVTTTTLNTAITSTTATNVSITGVTTSSWPTIFGYLKIDSEIVMYVGTQSNGISNITVYRAQAGTTAATHSAGATVTVMGNLTTTIASVTPGWAIGPSAPSWQVITLAASASTTVTNAHSYISLLGLPVTTTIGNCAIAMDDMDALESDWAHPSQSVGSLYPILLNVGFQQTNGNSNNSCSLYVQGQWGLYGLDVRNFNFFSSYFAVVQGTSELNSFQASNSGDFETWKHGLFTTDVYPWISYNGGEMRWEDVEVTALSGPQFLNLNNQWADGFGSANLNSVEFESWNTPPTGAVGWRITGTGNTISAEIGATNMPGILDTNSSTCNCFVGGGGLAVNGNNNTVNGMIRNAYLMPTDGGRGNLIYGSYNASPLDGYQTTQNVAANYIKGHPELLKSVSADFLRDGNPSVPYKWNDLFITPQEVNFAPSSPYSTYIVADTTAPFGEDIILNAPGVPTSGVSSFQQADYSTITPGNMFVGEAFPAVPMTLQFMASCPGGQTTFSARGALSNGYGATQSFSCTTSLAAYSIPLNFTGQTGYFQFNNESAFTIYVAFIDLIPAVTLPVGSTVGGSPIVLGPSTGTNAGDFPCYTNSTGLQADCGTMVNHQISNSTGSVQVNLFGNNNGSYTDYGLGVGSSRYWYWGLLGTGNYNFSFTDSINGHTIINFPNNTMPSNSIGGNANGATAITQPTTDNSVNIATDQFVKSLLPLSGTTGSIGGSALAAGACSSGTVSVSAATTSMAVAATPSTYPGDGNVWNGYVSASGTVTVKVCAIVAGTPTASTYNVRVIQ
jgi:hypothetical protein